MTKLERNCRELVRKWRIRSSQTYAYGCHATLLSDTAKELEAILGKPVKGSPPGDGDSPNRNQNAKDLELQKILRSAEGGMDEETRRFIAEVLKFVPTEPQPQIQIITSQYE